MSQVAVTIVHNGETETSPILSKIKTFADRIRDRAFNLSRLRGTSNGQELNDWLQAERDLTLAAEADLTEKDSTYLLSVALPGLSDKEIEVSALPDSLVVRAESTHSHETHEGRVHFCEFSEKSLCRRFDLPEPIDVDNVTAHFDKGILRVTAKKAAAAGLAIASAA